MNVVVAGGGTAGHVNPALAVAEELGDAVVTFVGTERGAETTLVPKAGGTLEFVDVVGFDRSQPWKLPATVVRALRATKGSIALLRKLEPDVVLGMGGYVSLPVGLAATRLRIPLVLHEQNIVLGLANRLLRRRARILGVSFEETLTQAGPRGRYVGLPVPRRLSGCDWDAERLRGLESFGLDPGRKTLLIFGGSLGAQSLNAAASGLAELWSERRDRQVVHISGSRHEPQTIEAGDLIFRSVGFVERMEEAYAVADLVVARGGANTVAELAIAGRGSIIVPYPHHRDRQQERHGRVMERAGAAMVMEDAAVTPRSIAQAADEMLSSDARLRDMGAAARTLARPDAAREMAKLVREAAS
ncbi:MAG: UDP-N-acetylglucosamine--N-acetylmuramyl-(pentapeptide) pyrophosphoryl-undecaprenol [Actinomycetota bacterium]|nr:UDP-N-acetylglucosamine--N-acetylmuramyl-(pentapeptide) pyrophosphoryl-undecaprenol [Actinomycetota bacterium]